MLCDECGIRLAHIHIKQIINGEAQERNLCEVCAAQLGIGSPGEIGGFEEFAEFPFGEGFLDIPDIFSSLLRRKPQERIFDYFSEEAQKVIALAREEAKRLGYDTVSTEHLMLGLIKEEGVAAKVLQEMGVDLVKLFSEIESQIGQQAKKVKEISLSPRAKKSLELAYHSARELGFNYVGPEHILLGIIREKENPAAQILAKRGLTSDKTIKQILKDLQATGIAPEETVAPGRPKTPALSTFSRDLTQMARENKLDPVIGRDKEIDRVMRILSRRTKNNPALIGEPGVGKTAIVEGLAQKIIKGDVPDSLKNKQVVSLDLAGMLAGTRYRGEFEQRIKKVLDEIIKNARRTIVFIDELHTLVGAGAAEGAIDAANIIKPSLAKGELQVIGATTLDEYRKNVEKDAALERRFQPVMVNEPTVEDTIEILKGLRDRYEAHHRVKITDQALFAAAHLGSRYISDRFLPDKAIDLMDEAAAKVRLKLISPAKEKKPLPEAKITEDDIAEIVADWTGIPVTRLTMVETERLLKMEETLHKRVVNQEEAINVISQAIRRGRAGLKAPQHPIGSFIFAGPTGVGKTEVARRLAEFLFGSIDALVRIDMSEYMEKHTVSRLIGAPPGYVGYEEGGMLTEAVRRKPYSVILIDEVEKAHSDVFNILLQVLEDGRLTDSKGRTVSFKNTVVIMTSNLGAKMIADRGGGIGFMAKEDREATYENIKEKVLDEMKKEFRPEFLNRIDEIIVFHPLTPEQIRQIVDIMLIDIQKQVEEKQMKLEVSMEAKNFLAKEGYEPKFGARPLRRALQRFIENPLSNEILEGKFKEGDSILADLKGKKIVFTKGTKKAKGKKK